MEWSVNETLRSFADEHGFISRESMRAALVATLGDNVKDSDVDIVMEKLGTGTSEGNSIVSITEAEAALKSFRRSSMGPLEINSNRRASMGGSDMNRRSSLGSNMDSPACSYDGDIMFEMEYEMDGIDGTDSFEDKLAKDYEVFDNTNRYLYISS